MAVTGFDIASGLITALGLPPETVSIDIHVGIEGPVTVTCRFYPERDALRTVSQVLRHYHLVPVDEPD